MLKWCVNTSGTRWSKRGNRWIGWRDNIHLRWRFRNCNRSIWELLDIQISGLMNAKRFKPLVDFIISDAVLAVGNKERLTRLQGIDQQRPVHDSSWLGRLHSSNPLPTTKTMVDQVVNIAKAGFSSDRTIAQYNEDIWHLIQSLLLDRVGFLGPWSFFIFVIWEEKGRNPKEWTLL